MEDASLPRSHADRPPSAHSGSTGADNVSGTPLAGQAAKRGSATFALHFTTLHKAATGAHAGTARVSLVLGVDKDCDPATGDADGVDRSATIRVEIDVTTDAKSGDE